MPYYADCDPYFVVQVTEDLARHRRGRGAESRPASVKTSAWIWIPWGWSRSTRCWSQQIMTGEAPDETWTGKFKVTFTQAVRQAIGPNTLAKFAFDFWIEGDLERIRLAFGDAVFRR